MIALSSTFLFLHVLSVSLWMGAALWVAGDVKRALALGRPHADDLSASIRPKLGLDLAGGIATIVTGSMLMGSLAIGRPRLGIMAGIVFTLARLGVLAALRRAFRSIAARLERGEAVDKDDPSARRMAMLSGLAHTLWLLALAGMIFPV